MIPRLTGRRYLVGIPNLTACAQCFFNSVINDLVDGTDCPVSNLTADPKLVVVRTLEETIRIKNDLETLVLLSKDKCKVLHLG